jgi:thiol-disulfide isomerase/thioredoxin
VRLSNYGGRVVLLEFWATWCPPCRASIPGIEKLHEKYGDKGLTVLAVSVDDGGWDDVRAFVRENGIKYSVLKGTEEVASAYGARSIPMLLLIDRTGAIARRYLGAGNDDDLEQDIRSLL